MIVFIVTFSLFFIEAILHYNYGRESKYFEFPDSKSLIQIIITVFIFSALNSRIIKYLQKYFKIIN
jgi:tetrahydromethanopterin S-methyltransferase subunit D